MSCYIDVVGCTNNDDHNGIDKGDCPYCGIDRLTAQLAKYKGGVEVEGEVVPYSDVVRWQGTIDLRLPEKMIGKRVRVLVMEVE